VSLFGSASFPVSSATEKKMKWREEQLPMSLKEFLRSFSRRHFAEKPVVMSQNVGCFLKSWAASCAPKIDEPAPGFHRTKNAEGITSRYFDFCHIGVYACQTNKLFCKHLSVVISRVCEDFLCHGHEGVPV